MKLATDRNNTEKTIISKVLYTLVYDINFAELTIQLPTCNTTELIRRLGTLQHKYRSLLNFSEHLKQKIALSAKAKAIYLDDESEDYINDVMASP